MRGSGRWAKDSRRPLPVGATPIRRALRAVLHVALQDAVLDQHGALRRVALVVDVERAAAIGNRAVVDDGHTLGRDTRADAAGKAELPLRLKSPSSPWPDCLVQQDAGPAGTEATTVIVPAGAGRASRLVTA